MSQACQATNSYVSSPLVLNFLVTEPATFFWGKATWDTAFTTRGERNKKKKGKKREICLCPSVRSTHGRRNAARCLCLLRTEVFDCCWFVCVKVLMSAMEANTWSPGHSSSVGGFREWVQLMWFSFFHGPQICSTLDVEDICPPGKNNLNSLGHFSPFSFASVHTNRMSSLNRKEILKPRVL